MNGEQLNQYLERGFGGTTLIRKLAFESLNMQLNRPSDMNANRGVPDSVTEQYHRVDASWDAGTSTLTVSKEITGPGYWIPYLGNGIPNVGTHLRGLGTYTPIVPATTISWVATGPFSGCHAYVFTPLRFAHVITPAGGYSADAVANQRNNIPGAVRAGGLVRRGRGDAFVFWTHLRGGWYQREVYVNRAGNVLNVGRRRRV